MKIDFSTPITDFDGNPLEQNGPLTLGRIAALALNHPAEDQQHSALERGLLAMRVYKAGEMDLSPEDAALIRGALAAVWAPIVVAQAHALLG